MNNSKQLSLPLPKGQMLFRARGGVKALFRNRLDGAKPVAQPLVRVPLLEGEIMRGTEDPSTEVLSRPQVAINHLNFVRDRIKPYFTQNASVGVDLYNREKTSVRLQADAQNLSNKLEVIDFGGLFSGNALGPSRQYTFRLVTTF
jgi:hypothetical protein